MPPTTLAEPAADAGLADPEELGSDLLLIDGANARVVHSGDHDAMRRGRWAAARLIVIARTPSGPAVCTPGTMVPEDDENTEH
ncbi:hypothetical protein [Streptomyces shenzhenensis]|uniref:hypothetical protein n=1 Tax=Streptomyces shenzhenensis TaxID=943815 RepID=UPI0033C9AED9